MNSSEMEAGLCAPAVPTDDQPVSTPSAALRDESYRLFHWIPPNLSSAVPDDVRAFTQRFAA